MGCQDVKPLEMVLIWKVWNTVAHGTLTSIQAFCVFFPDCSQNPGSHVGSSCSISSIGHGWRCKLPCLIYLLTTRSNARPMETLGCINCYKFLNCYKLMNLQTWFRKVVTGYKHTWLCSVNLHLGWKKGLRSGSSVVT